MVFGSVSASCVSRERTCNEYVKDSGVSEINVILEEFKIAIFK